MEKFRPCALPMRTTSYSATTRCSMHSLCLAYKWQDDRHNVGWMGRLDCVVTVIEILFLYVVSLSLRAPFMCVRAALCVVKHLFSASLSFYILNNSNNKSSCTQLFQLVSLLRIWKRHATIYWNIQRRVIQSALTLVCLLFVNSSSHALSLSHPGIGIVSWLLPTVFLSGIFRLTICLPHAAFIYANKRFDAVIN